ncbi:hypothetical protein AN618_24570 [Fervidicola ferrireducens]|uniref:Uncharacterized protein n=1 Tax=Fervidicola ferrireducens TaxID=520764 RepID=A0A140KZP8_9FIRM|nr:hypothetical protein AN618_24570 [Fervidicola ferrireducens]
MLLASWPISSRDFTLIFQEKSRSAMLFAILLISRIGLVNLCAAKRAHIPDTIAVMSPMVTANLLEMAALSFMDAIGIQTRMTMPFSRIF